MRSEILLPALPRSRKVNISLTAATYRNLEQRVAEELFRSDLYFRLRIFEIALPLDFSAKGAVRELL